MFAIGGWIVGACVCLKGDLNVCAMEFYCFELPVKSSLRLLFNVQLLYTLKFCVSNASRKNHGADVWKVFHGIRNSKIGNGGYIKVIPRHAYCLCENVVAYVVSQLQLCVSVPTSGTVFHLSLSLPLSFFRYRINWNNNTCILATRTSQCVNLWLRSATSPRCYL